MPRQNSSRFFVQHCVSNFVCENEARLWITAIGLFHHAFTGNQQSSGSEVHESLRCRILLEVRIFFVIVPVKFSHEFSQAPLDECNRVERLA